MIYCCFLQKHISYTTIFPKQPGDCKEIYNFSTTFYCTNKNVQVMVEVNKNPKSYKIMS